nr:MAG TPA: hypothetical protein [Caudoviricetes sp.]
MEKFKKIFYFTYAISNLVLRKIIKTNKQIN